MEMKKPATLWLFSLVFLLVASVGVLHKSRLQKAYQEYWHRNDDIIVSNHNAIRILYSYFQKERQKLAQR